MAASACIVLLETSPRQIVPRGLDILPAIGGILEKRATDVTDCHRVGQALAVEDACVHLSVFPNNDGRRQMGPPVQSPLRRRRRRGAR